MVRPIRAFLCPKQGFVVAMSLAIAVDLASSAVFMLLGNYRDAYIYYAGLFLVLFGWWIATDRLGIIHSQMVAGISCVVASIALLDCYFADGYATVVSSAFPYVILLLNVATIWAAWNDRDWTCNAHYAGWGKYTNQDSEVNHKC